ncbi:MAG: alpha/beta fold hydrolase, partial [Stellaceae bacterium]
GLHGVMPIGGIMGAAIPDRPLYVLNARGLDGTQPPHESMEDMVAAYLGEIREARPSGPYILGGVCAGGLLAMELARRLRSQGERVGTVVLVDPPLVPFSRVPIQRNIDPKDPFIYRQLYENTEKALLRYVERFDAIPYDARDPVKLRAAIETGIATTVMFYRYVPPVFEGPTEFIISAERAFSHFHPEGPWKSVVPSPGRFHVIPGNHDDFFFTHLDPVLRLIRFSVDQAVFSAAGAAQ